MREAKVFDLLVRLRGPDEFLRYSGAKARSALASLVPLGSDSFPWKLLCICFQLVPQHLFATLCLPQLPRHGPWPGRTAP